MQGLRDINDLNDLEFKEFFSLVQKQANSENSVFFLDDEEGNEGVVNNIVCMDLTGWLIPKEKANIFEKKFLKNKEEIDVDKWDIYYTGSTWKDQDGEIEISFKNLFWAIEACSEDNFKK